MMKFAQYTFTRLTIITIALFLLGGSIGGWLSYRLITNSMLDQGNENLEAVLNSRAILVENYIAAHQNQIRYLAQNETVVHATKALSAGFVNLPNEVDINMELDSSSYVELIEYYKQEMPHISGLNQAASPESYLPVSESGRLLHWLYIANNPNSVTTMNEMFSSSVESSYNLSHQIYHPEFNYFLNAFELHDVLLLDTQGNLIYSTRKELDLGTNLDAGVYAESGLGDAYNRAMTQPRQGFSIVDFSNYEPSYHEPSAFIASPIFENANRLGVLVFQLSATQLNQVIADYQGLGTSGETYIIGDDLLMRTASRFTSSSSMLQQEVDTVAGRQLAAGHAGSGIIEDYRGVEVLSRYKPLNIEGLNWGMLAEIDIDEFSAPANSLAVSTALVLALTLMLIAFVSNAALRLCVVRPMSQLLAAAKKIVDGDYSARVDIVSDDEFSVLADRFNLMASSVQMHIDDLEKALREVKELKGLLPICASCKSIRDDDGYFRTVETYFAGKSHLEFSHTICQECLPRLYPELNPLSNKDMN
ncbi:MAG: hypothetical protein COA96_02885 [SAR86 cluster bacterium]|uniref:HAMP domain-containing protein n=1 Tax=SAR86 cluster bacterium TaxID=2030880 RepID=A0A2A5B7X1_9GAMM|nr:MAG: hypothetical protein COA96_02885 [SAR86 cluster bacterium]